MVNIQDYLNFLHSKMVIAPETGFEVSDSEIHPILKQHQKEIDTPMLFDFIKGKYECYPET
jgi:hypothetical protein